MFARYARGIGFGIGEHPRGPELDIVFGAADQRCGTA